MQFADQTKMEFYLYLDACGFGDMKTVLQYLHQNMDVQNALDAGLVIASEEGRYDIAQVLIERKAHITVDAMTNAMRNRHDKLVILFIENGYKNFNYISEKYKLLLLKQGLNVKYVKDHRAFKTAIQQYNQNHQ